MSSRPQKWNSIQHWRYLKAIISHQWKYSNRICFIFDSERVQSFCLETVISKEMQLFEKTKQNKSPATNSPGIPGKCDKVSITYRGINISGRDILPSFTGSQLKYLVYIANPEKHVKIESDVKMGQFNHNASLADFKLLKILIDYCIVSLI